MRDRFDLFAEPSEAAADARGRLTVRLGEVRFLQAMADASTSSADQMLEELALPRGLFGGPDNAELPMRDYFRMLRWLTETTGDETCAASSRKLLSGTTHFLLESLPPRASLFDMLGALARGYNLAHAGPFNRVVREGDEVGYVIDDRQFPYALNDKPEWNYLWIESILVSLHILLVEMTDGVLRDRVARLASRRPCGLAPSPFLQFWRQPVRRNAPHYAIFYRDPGAVLSISKERLTTVTTIFDIVTDYFSDTERVERPGGETPAAWARRVRNVMARGVFDQSAIAAELGVSVATLRRRLSEEGASFRALKALTLDERARRLLLSGYPIETVADKLGFADARSFSRSFKSWRGVTPGVYRQLGLERPNGG